MRISDKVLYNTAVISGIINFDAVFSDETVNYVNPFEPDEYDNVKIRLRIRNLFFIIMYLTNHV